MTLDEIIAIHNGLDPATRPRFFTSRWQKLVRVTYQQVRELPSGETLVLYEEHLPSRRVLFSVLRVAADGIEVKELTVSLSADAISDKWKEVLDAQIAPAGAPERAAKKETAGV